MKFPTAGLVIAPSTAAVGNSGLPVPEQVMSIDEVLEGCLYVAKRIEAAY